MARDVDSSLNMNTIRTLTQSALFRLALALAPIGAVACGGVEGDELSAEEVTEDELGFASADPRCQGELVDEIGESYTELERAGDRRAIVRNGRSYLVGAVLRLRVWSGGAFVYDYVQLHDVDGDGICEARTLNPT